MLAASWNSSAKTYSFEETYPIASYDIEIRPNDSCTEAQFEAWSSAQIVGSVSANTCKAFGDIPTIDIPIVISVTPK